MPTYDQMTVQRARFAVESTTFGDDLTDDVATNFFDLRHEPIKFIPKTDMVQDTTVVQRAFEQRNDVLGPSRASAACTFMWTGTNEALNAAATPTKRAQSKLMEALLGGYNAAAGSLAASGEATTGCVVTAAQGSRFTEGTIIGITVAGVIYPRLVTSRATDTLVWWPALPAAPATGAVILNSQSIFLTDTPATQIQMLFEAAKQRGNIWTGLGGWGDFSMDFTRGGLAKWSSTLNFADYEHDDEFDVPQGGSAIALASYDDTGPIVVSKGGCHFGASSSSTLSLVRCAGLTVNFAREFFDVGLHSGVEGRTEPELNSRTRRTLEITLLKPDPYEDYWEAHQAQTNYGLLFWLDGGAGGTQRTVCVPTMQICAEPEPVEAFGMEGLKISCLIKESNKASAQTAEVQRSPIVIGMT